MLEGHFHGTLTQHLSPRSRSAYEACSHTAYTRIYSAHDVVDVELAGHRIFSSLLDHLIEAQVHPEYSYSRTLLSRVSSQYDIHSEDLETRIMAIIDYISGMTDVYALDIYQKIKGIALPIV